MADNKTASTTSSSSSNQKEEKTESVKRAPEEQRKIDEEENLIRRVLYFKNPYDVLDIPADTTMDEIQRKYKRLALQLHPDKCKHPKAQEAFNALNRANKVLDAPEIRRRFGEIMAEVREKVVDEEEKKEQQGEKPKRGAALEYEIKMRTQKRLIELEESSKKAEYYKTVNEQRFKMDEMKKKEEERQQMEEILKWQEGITDRVDGWRKFMSGGEKKRKATTGLKPPKLKQQTRENSTSATNVSTTKKL